jgi:hypothetical protein
MAGTQEGGMRVCLIKIPYLSLPKTTLKSHLSFHFMESILIGCLSTCRKGHLTPTFQANAHITPKNLGRKRIKYHVFISNLHGDKLQHWFLLV